LPKYAIKIKNKLKGYLEELRLLYVAMTRAKNKLIITGKYSPSLFEKFDEMKKTSYQNMILSVYSDRLIEGENEFKYCDIKFIDDIEKVIIPTKNKGKIEFIGENFIYPYEKTDISIKNSVTGLNSKKSEETKFSTKTNLTTQKTVSTKKLMKN
jgi:ATP-dependent exoDNAse (exonuclease V) beta subunit